MPRKSTVRLHAEAALNGIGINYTDAAIFVDKSKSGHRVKFSFVRAGRTQLESIHAVVATLNPGHEVKVWNQRETWPGGYYGLCVKIYNN